MRKTDFRAVRQVRLRHTRERCRDGVSPHEKKKSIRLDSRSLCVYVWRGGSGRNGVNGEQGVRSTRRSELLYDVPPIPYAAAFYDKA